MGDPGLIPGLGKSSGEKKWQHPPVFLPGEFQGQRSLVGDSPWGHKESHMTKRLSLTKESHQLRSRARVRIRVRFKN